jgi:hypothetical protein
MLDPFFVDTRFANLKHSLSLLSSRRLRLLRLAEFAEPLLDQDAVRFLAAYLQEFIPPLTDALLHTDFTGTPASFGRRLSSLMERLTSLFPDIEESPDWVKAKQKLMDQLQESGETLKRKGTAREPSPPGRINGVWLPFVERERILAETVPQFGTLRLMEVEVRPLPEAQGADEIKLDDVDTFEPGIQEGFLRAMKAAREWAATASPHTRLEPMKVICKIDLPGQLAGDSLLGGFAAAAACALLKSISHREEYGLREDVAVTGSINEKGELLPVDRSALRVKVEACLHSPIRILVVPRAQEALCAEHLKGALEKEDFGAGEIGEPLKIVGVSALADILNNRLLVSSRNIPTLLRAGRQVWRRRRSLAVIIFAAMALIIARLITGPIDKVPVTGHFAGNQLVLENRGGQLLSSLDVGERVASIAALCVDGPFGMFALARVSRSGETDDLCFYPAAESSGTLFEVRCWSARRRDILWRLPLNVTLRFPRHQSPVERVFTIRQIIAGDLRNDGSNSLFVLANGSGFASIVVEINVTSGAIRGMYVHIGHLEAMQAIDFDQDGIKEICLCGMNNAFGRQACLVVLDPRNISGHGPLKDEYEVEGIEPARHRACVLIPPTIVGNAFRHLSTATKARSLYTTQDGSHQIKLLISDVSQLSSDCFSTTTADYYLTFNSRIEPSEMLTGNDYDKLAENLLEEQKIPYLPKKTPGYQEAFFHTLAYWEGGAWKRR